MKLNVLILSLALIINFNNLSAQKSTDFQGTVTYNVAVEGELDAMTKAQIPTEMTQTYKGNKVRTEQKSSMGSTIIITDNETKITTILLDMMGNKMAITQTKEDADKALQEMPEVKVTNSEETKTIAGYNCKKATVEMTGEEKSVLDVYYTNEIIVNNPNSLSFFKDIKGVLLEYTQSAGEIKMKFTAKKVKKAKVKKSIYKIPEGYQQLTQEQFRSMLGQ
ncbi:MAG: hypothetical protein A2046_05210 [Bacteroidetes bacterium GWA2_30_7]|nr:MAG: hypothetical protein A2046_05210 [Bacteroidetes bacterium GWA2_30_7]